MNSLRHMSPSHSAKKWKNIAIINCMIIPKSFLKFFLRYAIRFGAAPFEIFFKTIDFSFEVNSATSPNYTFFIDFIEHSVLRQRCGMLKIAISLSETSYAN